MQKKICNATARYALVQGMFWMSFSVVFGFSSAYLLPRSFSNTQIGMLIAIAGTISAILQPLVAGFADQSKKVSLKKIITWIALLILCLEGSLLVIPAKMILVALLYGMIITLLQVLTPLVNALGMDCIKQGGDLNFGLARGMGSLSYALISYLTGGLVKAYGTDILPIIIICIYTMFILFIFLFRYEKVGDRKNKLDSIEDEYEADVTPKPEETRFFARYHKFRFLLLGCTLIFASHNMLNNFLLQIIEEKGGGSSEMGIVMALAAVCELPTMFLFIWMAKKIRCDIWMKLSGIFFVLKSIGTLLVGTVYGMYLIQGLQMFGFALYAVSSVYYVNSIMKEQDRIKGQAYMTMTSTLGSVLGASLGGMIIGTRGIPAMLIVSSIAATLGTIIMWYATEKV